MQNSWEQHLFEQVRSLIARGVTEPIDDREFEAVALRVLHWQTLECVATNKALAAASLNKPVNTLDDVVGLPTDVFKVSRIATFAREREKYRFHTSGTTRDTVGKHRFSTLELYELAATQTAARWLLPLQSYHCVFLAESEQDAPHSSLSAMLGMFAKRWQIPGQPDPWCVREKKLDQATLEAHRRWIESHNAPVALLGSTFAFVHFADQFAKLSLPAGSVVMPTGGFKGRSRELPIDEFLALVQSHFSVDRKSIVQEYGMTELSSQAYESHEGEVPLYQAPPWMRIDAVNPGDLSVLQKGSEGILRVIDLANIGSCIAIQTLDLGTVYDHGFTVKGRLPGATPRGCGRAMDALLSGNE